MGSDNPAEKTRHYEVRELMAQDVCAYCKARSPIVWDTYYAQREDRVPIQTFMGTMVKVSREHCEFDVPRCEICERAAIPKPALQSMRDLFAAISRQVTSLTPLWKRGQSAALEQDTPGEATVTGKDDIQYLPPLHHSSIMAFKNDGWVIMSHPFASKRDVSPEDSEELARESFKMSLREDLKKLLKEDLDKLPREDLDKLHGEDLKKLHGKDLDKLLEEYLDKLHGEDLDKLLGEFFDKLVREYIEEHLGSK